MCPGSARIVPTWIISSFFSRLGAAVKHTLRLVFKADISTSDIQPFSPAPSITVTQMKRTGPQAGYCRIRTQGFLLKYKSFRNCKLPFGRRVFLKFSSLDSIHYFTWLQNKHQFQLKRKKKKAEPWLHRYSELHDSYFSKMDLLKLTDPRYKRM